MPENPSSPFQERRGPVPTAKGRVAQMILAQEARLRGLDALEKLLRDLSADDEMDLCALFDSMTFR